MKSFSKKANITAGVELPKETAEKKPFVATQEQEMAKDMVIKNPTSKIQAGAGTGKTSELVYISTYIKEPSLYMTFNVTMAREAEGKFGDHVACMTTHSLAYRKVGKGYQHKLSRPQGRYVNVALTPSEVAKYFRLPDFEVTSVNEIKSNFLGLLVRDTVDRFEASDHEEITEKNIPYKHIKDLEEKYGSKFPKKKFKSFVLRYALRLWEERTDKLSEVCCKHNTYLKLYELSKPELSPEYSMIYLDEGQDLNPVTMSIIRQQEGKCRIVVCGDSYQQIYSWNGSVNAMQSLKVPSSLLSQSFRFGKEVADLATMILDNKMELSGFDNINSEVGVNVVDFTKPHTILFRTNMELIFTAVKLIREGKNISVNMDVQDFVNILKAADSLFKGDLHKIKHEKVIPYTAWEDLVEEGKDDRELGRVVSIVDDGEAERMIKILLSHKNDQNAQITLTTAHKSKGLEFDQVVLVSDFPSNYNRKGEFVGLSEEERNLLYVAATRAIFKLNINKTCEEFYDINDKKKLADNVDKVSGSCKIGVRHLSLFGSGTCKEELEEGFKNMMKGSDNTHGVCALEDAANRGEDSYDLEGNPLLLPTDEILSDNRRSLMRSFL